MLNHLDHVIVAVRDLEAATRTLARLLGRGPSWRGEHPDLGTANALFRLSNTYVELLVPAGSGGFGDLLRVRLDAEGEGLLGLAFGTADAAACCESLRARGIDARRPQPGHGRERDSGAVRNWRSVLLPAADARGLLLFAIEHEGTGDELAPAPLQAVEAASVYGLDHVVVGVEPPSRASTCRA